MKKVLSVILVLIVFVTALPMTALASPANYEVGEEIVLPDGRKMQLEHIGAAPAPLTRAAQGMYGHTTLLVDANDTVFTAYTLNSQYTTPRMNIIHRYDWTELLLLAYYEEFTYYTETVKFATSSTARSISVLVNGQTFGTYSVSGGQVYNFTVEVGYDPYSENHNIQINETLSNGTRAIIGYANTYMDDAQI